MTHLFSMVFCDMVLHEFGITDTAENAHCIHHSQISFGVFWFQPASDQLPPAFIGYVLSFVFCDIVFCEFVMIVEDSSPHYCLRICWRSISKNCYSVCWYYS